MSISTSYRFLLIAGWLITCSYAFGPKLHTAENRNSYQTNTIENQPEIDYNKRISHYLDQQTKTFLQKMSVREKFLLQMIINITDEIEQRGASGILDGDVGFKEIYEKQEELIKRYSIEVENIVSLIRELEDLENYVSKTEKHKIIEEIVDLKSHLMAVLENRQLYKKKEYTKSEAAKLVQEYSDEIDSLLKIYDRLDRFERVVQEKSDQEMLSTIQEQKQKLVKILGIWTSEDDSKVQADLIKEYITEAERIVEILKQMDQLAMASRVDSTGISGDIEKTKVNLVQTIDKRIFKIFNYQVHTKHDGPSISDYLKQWKAKKYSDFLARLTQYRIFKNRLITTAAENERNRMLEKDLSDALISYAANKFDLAEMQFKEVIQSYAEYYPNMDGVIFYISEANYARSYFDAAYEGYTELIESYPHSKYLAQSLWKMMLISYTYGWKQKFYSYFEKLNNMPESLGRQKMSNAYYLAGYVYSENRRFKEARGVLEKLSKDSKYYYPCQYLLGIVFVNLDNYSKAKKIFEKLADEENYPWTDLNVAIIRNNALIKLGYIHYQRAEYEKAIKIFERVSQGYNNYDKSIIAQAWANLKSGKYEESIKKVNNLLGNYLSSNFTYEALVLSAHCKRILNRTEEAKKDLRYVTNAHGILELTQKYHNERRRILEQAKELDRLEIIALERQDKLLYPEMVKIRDNVNEALLTLNYRGLTGSLLMEQFNDERKNVVRQIERLDEMIQLANSQGNTDAVRKVEKQRERLIDILETYKTDKSLSNATYFMDYPLATKEGGIIYRRGIIKKMFQDMIAEKKRLESDINEIMKLLPQTKSLDNIESNIDLEILEKDLQDLRNRLNRLQIWLVQNKLDDLNTNFDQWADFSGFGMSDINFSALKDKGAKIATYSQNIAVIDKILTQKRALLEKKIEQFNKQMAKVEKKMEQERIRLEKLERQKYFQNIYFDTKEKEVEKKAEDVEFERLIEEELKRHLHEKAKKNESQIPPN